MVKDRANGRENAIVTRENERARETVNKIKRYQAGEIERESEQERLRERAYSRERERTGEEITNGKRENECIER